MHEALTMGQALCPILRKHCLGSPIIPNFTVEEAEGTEVKQLAQGHTPHSILPAPLPMLHMEMGKFRDGNVCYPTSILGS